MPAATVTPIDVRDLVAVGRFLNAHLNAKFSADAWVAALTHPWCAAQPNYGVQLHDGGKLVGVFCAIYSTQTIRGRLENFCNPHSWCVLPEYRNQGIGLALALVRQPGYHFTMLTPNPKVAEIFRHLKFTDLADGMVVFPNLPSARVFSVAASATDDSQAIHAMVTDPVRRAYELHRDIAWLRFVAIGTREDNCLIVYKPGRWKRLPSARIIHISDPGALGRHIGALRNYLALRRGLLVSIVESRFLVNQPALAIHQRRTQAKLYLSASLNDSEISDLYSELAALDV